MMNASSRGHIHIFGLFLMVVIIAGFLAFWDWQRKSLALHDQILRIEQQIEKLDAKVKYLELKADTASLLPSKGQPSQP